LATPILFESEEQPPLNLQLRSGHRRNQAHHLNTQPQFNNVEEIAPPSQNPQNYVPFPTFARGSTYSFTEGNSYYHSLQATFDRRFSGGLTVLVDYTYSKCRQDARTLLTGDIGGYRAPGIPGFGIKGDYALCDWEVPQIFHASGGYELPIGRGHSLLGNVQGVANQIVSGWQTYWILTLQDGQPFTVGCPNATAAGLGCNALLVPGQNVYGGLHNVNSGSIRRPFPSRPPRPRCPSATSPCSAERPPRP